MAGQLFDFDQPDRFVAGTVGQPGERTFYLQASGGGRLVSVALEKVQVQALAEKIDELLDEVRRRQGDESAIPPTAPRQLEDVAPLEVPIEEEFRVGTLALAWDGDTETVLVEAQSATGEEEEQPPAEFTGDMLRVRLTPDIARAFARRAQRVVAAGRPPCPLCGNPLDPQGHVCPRQNGHRGPR
ncbi:MAG TPA: DUF3090 family protein [Mycobacteriales bacterium]|nr:DUF3090 family protein [Mycobacteriales bacterium]